jgi:hypothetical protein
VIQRESTGSITAGTIFLVLAVFGVSALISTVARTPAEPITCSFGIELDVGTDNAVDPDDQPSCNDRRGLDRGACYDERFRQLLDAFEADDFSLSPAPRPAPVTWGP